MAAIPSLSHTADGPRLYLARLLEEMDRAAISTRLRDARKQAGLSQEEMADILKVHVNSVQGYERPSLKTVPFDRLDEWAAATGVTKTWLLQGEAAVEADRLAEIEVRLESIATAVAAVEVSQGRLIELLEGRAGRAGSQSR